MTNSNSRGTLYIKLKAGFASYAKQFTLIFFAIIAFLIFQDISFSSSSRDEILLSFLEIIVSICLASSPYYEIVYKVGEVFFDISPIELFISTPQKYLRKLQNHLDNIREKSIDETDTDLEELLAHHIEEVSRLVSGEIDSLRTRLIILISWTSCLKAYAQIKILQISDVRSRRS